MVNTTQQAFTQAKERSLKLLKSVEQFLQNGEKLEVEIDLELKNKLTNAMQEKQDEKLKVALIGGYSEGKTTIAGAWLGKVEKDMNISKEESTDAVKIYHPNDDIDIVDTPGLYGFKERNIDATHIEQYKEITKKYISQAHLLLYVMNSSNPIKASHKDDLQWLFKDLGLLDRTIFVLSKFDEMADIEDENEYKKMFSTAKDNVVKGLDNALSLSTEQNEKISVVAISANPFDRGLDYWLQHLKEFKSLSRIDDLQEKTKGLITQLGDKDIITNEARKSIIKDVIHTQIPKLKEEIKLIESNMQKLQESYNVTRKDLDKIKPRIDQARINLREFATHYFTDIILQLEGTSLETFSEFFEKNIGSEGILLDSRIKNNFEKEVGSIVGQLNVMQNRFNGELKNINSNIEKYGKLSVTFLQKSGLINPNNVKLARDAIVNIGSMVGFNLGTMLKFKPWGAVKFAKGANAALAAFNIVFEAWDSYKKAEKEKEFEKIKAKLKNDLETQRKEMLDMIDSESFIPQFFSDYVELKEKFKLIDEALKYFENKQEEFLQWQKEGEMIEQKLIG